MAILKIDGMACLHAENYKLMTDDRAELIQLDGGNTVQDYGHVPSGDKMTVSAIWWRDDFLALWRIYEDRRRVDFVDPAGVLWPKCRIRIISYGYFEHFENRTVRTELEVWRI